VIVTVTVTVTKAAIWGRYFLPHSPTSLFLCLFLCWKFLHYLFLVQFLERGGER